MQRILGLPDPAIVIYEERIEAAVRAALQSVADKVADRIAGIQVASALVSAMIAADTPPDSSVPPGDGLPPGQPYVSPDELASITPAWQSAVEDQLLPIVAQIFMDAAGQTHANMVDATNIRALPSVGSLAAEQYLAQAEATFDQIGQDLWETARGELLDGFERGESIPQLADRVRGAADISARTSVLVARTQVIEASNAGSFQTAQVSGIEMRKEWIATPDLRTRPTHLQADGQRVDLADNFVVGGYSAMFPAAPSLPPAERYNCRCTIGYVMSDDAVEKMRENLARQQEQDNLPGTEGPLTQFYPKTAAPGPPGGIPTIPEGLVGRQGASSIRPALRTAGTPQELTQAWQAEMKRITGRDIIVQLPPGASLVTMKQYAEATSAMLERFPEMRLRKISWYDADGPEYAHVRRGAATLEFNARWASEENRRAYLSALRSDAAGWGEPAGRGWSVRGATTPQATAYHELGHILSLETLGGRLDSQAVAIVRRRALLEGIGADELIARDISAYATGPTEEMIAEAFTDVVLNGEAASRVSRELYEMLTDEYRRAGLAVRTAPIVEDLSPFEDFTRTGLGEAFPKTAAPGARLASMKVAELRALAKERGVAIPAGARKADLVKALEESSTAAPAGPATERAALRAAARERNRLIESSTSTGKLLAKLDELIAGKATKAVIRQELDPALLEAEQLYAGADRAVVDSLRAALDTGDTAKLRAALTRAGTKSKIKPIGRAGAKSTYDPETMEGVGGITIEPGTPVTVVRRGSTLTLPDGSTMQIGRARVTPVLAKPVKAVKAAPVKRLTKAERTAVARQADIDAARAIGDLGAEVLELIDSGASARALTARIEAAAKRLKTPDAVREALIAQVEDRDALRAAVADQLSTAGVDTAGTAGKVVRFDRKIMDPIGNVKDGDWVVIDRPGTTLNRQGEAIQLGKAQVSKASPAEAAQARAEAEAAVRGTYPARLAATRKAVDSEITGESRPLGGGMTGTVTLVERADGTIVEKVYGQRYRMSRKEIKDMTDAEILGASVLDSTGVRSAATVRTGADCVASELLEGKTGIELFPPMYGPVTFKDLDPEFQALIRSDEGRLMGIADYLMYNIDRNSGNWVRLTGSDHLGGFDHGGAFQLAELRQPAKVPAGDFSEWLQDPITRELTSTIDVDRRDLAIIRAKLEALRPQFTEASRSTWFNAMMRRLSELEKRAVGTRQMIAG